MLYLASIDINLKFGFWMYFEVTKEARPLKTSTLMFVRVELK